MTDKIINVLINILLIILFVFIFIYSKTVKETIIYGIYIWINNLIPSMFPFLLISKLMIYNNLVFYLNNIFGKYIRILFNVPESSSFAIILSLITGFPTGAIYIKELLNSKLIDIEDANKLIMYTSYSSPIFVISVIGETLLNNKSLGLYIYIIHVITGLFIGLILRGRKGNINKSIFIKNNELKTLSDAIKESFETLINILGILLFFLLIISIINIILPNNTIAIILKSILEITTGVINISRCNINIKLKASIIGFIISFNSLSIHYQIKSIIEDTNIKYSNYLYARIVHSILCFILIYLLF